MAVQHQRVGVLLRRPYGVKSAIAQRIDGACAHANRSIVSDPPAKESAP